MLLTSQQLIIRPFVTFYCIAIAFAAPLSSSSFNELIYNYETSTGSGPNSLRFTATAHLERLYVSDEGHLLRLHLKSPKFYQPDNHKQQLDSSGAKHSHIFNEDNYLIAHVVISNDGTASVKSLYTHQTDSTTSKNLKKSILVNLLPTNHHLNTALSSGHPQAPLLDNKFLDDNNYAQPELFSPDSISQVSIVAKQKVNPVAETTTSNNQINPMKVPSMIAFQTIEGYQNVTFRSRVFSQAESNLTTEFKLLLKEELESSVHEKFDGAGSLGKAVKMIANFDNYQADTIHLQRERRICSTHHCGKSLGELLKQYKSFMAEDSMASVEAAVAFLKIVDRLRDSRGTSAQELLNLLKKMRGDQGVKRSFLDMLAAARTKESITAALKYIKFPRTDDLDLSERFLSVLSVASQTAAKMHPTRAIKSPYDYTMQSALKRSTSARKHISQMASLEFIAEELRRILDQTPARQWASEKLRHSTILTLATIVNANNQEHNLESTNELTKAVNEFLLHELKSCEKSDVECRIVSIHAIGNVGVLTDDQFQALRDHVLNSGRRESVSAMRVLRDLLQTRAKGTPLAHKFLEDLKYLLMRVVYDSSYETTARVLAAEMIVRFVPNDLTSQELLRNLPAFGNNELATMIYSRMQSLKPGALANHHVNWFWKSHIINGTSTSFVRTMAKTEALNASYGVNVELLDKGKILKESSFDLFLDTRQKTQDLFSFGIFARGLSGLSKGSMFSSSDDDSDEESESAMAGMSLKLLGGYLRPYTFFTGFSELMGYAWKGASGSAFSGDLMLIDHDEGYPLINGFVAEQQMRGVLSIDVSGKVTISMWHQNANALVRTKASVIVQSSQSIFTSYEDLWQSHLFSFGGEALIDFISDISFSSTPFKLCLQVTQPEFIVRYNTRRHKQTMTDEVRRKITRRNYPIEAKSYPLNAENNKVCSLMSDEL